MTNLDDHSEHTLSEPGPLPTLNRWYRWSERNLGLLTAIGIAVVLVLPLIVFVGFGIAMQRWPWQLLLFSYPLMLVLLSPYILLMLLTARLARSNRRSANTEQDCDRNSSTLLLVIGSVVLTASIGGYGWLIYLNGWNLPGASRFLVVLAILGLGAIIRGLPFKRSLDH